MTEPLFDPEKVERFFAQTGIAEFDEDTCVSSNNYDKLLSLYRETLSTCESAPQQLP